MPLKFRLKGLAETFVDNIRCAGCGHDGGVDGDEGFGTSLTRVTFEGIIAVIRCDYCGNVFVPQDQKLGIIDSSKLHDAVQKDSLDTGEPVYPTLESVKLDVERQNAERVNGVH